MKVAVLQYHYNYSGSSHRTSDGWFKGDYSKFSVLVLLTVQELTTAQRQIVNNFIHDNTYDEHDNRSDGPDYPTESYDYSPWLSLQLGKLLLFDQITKETHKPIYAYGCKCSNVKEFNIDGVVMNIIHPCKIKM